jgi:hypothetical protein
MMVMTNTGNQMTLKQADVAAILNELRNEVRARRIALGQSELSPLERDLQRSLDEIELYRVVSAHWPLIGKTLPQRAITLVNKLVRRYLRWYINPIVEQQNAYNDAVARTLRLLADAYVDLGEQIMENKAQRTPNKDSRNPEPRIEIQAPEATSHGELSAAEENGPRTTDHGQIHDLQAKLMALVRERAAAEPPARFPDLELRAAEPQLRLREQVSAHWPLGGTTASQRAVALVNKLVRRYLRWYINPIVEQQNAANAAIGAALLAIIRLDAERRAQVANLRASDKMKG